jgi:hypothetical protein
VISSAILLQAAQRLSRAQGQGVAPGSRQEALARRNAAMVAFLAVLPIRRPELLRAGARAVVSGGGAADGRAAGTRGDQDG